MGHGEDRFGPFRTSSIQRESDRVLMYSLKLKLPVTAARRELLDAMARLMSAGKCLLGGAVGGNSVSVLRSLHPFSQQLRTFVQMGTKLKVVDNSGAKLICCIQALKGRKGARLGDTIVASVKEAQPRGKIKKGQVGYASWPL